MQAATRPLKNGQRHTKEATNEMHKEGIFCRADNGENKHQPVASGKTGLLNSIQEAKL
jgi:hypothetical protein